jgi:hypothetical protein
MKKDAINKPSKRVIGKSSLFEFSELCNSDTLSHMPST